MCQLSCSPEECMCAALHRKVKHCVGENDCPLHLIRATSVSQQKF